MPVGIFIGYVHRFIKRGKEKGNFGDLAHTSLL